MDHAYRYDNGRPLGPLAQTTTLKYQETLLALVEERPWRGIRIVDIARANGMSPASVYQYYPTLDALALVTADRLIAEGTELSPHFKLIVDLLRFEAEPVELTLPTV